MPLAIAYPEAIMALFRADPLAEIVSVAGNPYAYWSVFTSLWREGRPFIIVEHDIVVTAQVLDDLASCGGKWCAFTYHEEIGEPVSGLGCTKFVPTIPLYLEAGWGDPIWQNVDTTVAGLLQAAGWRVHEHGPWLRHLNPKVATMQSETPR
jgi:hypothetical protein